MVQGRSRVVMVPTTRAAGGCGHYVCLARVNVYLPDDLVEAARAAHLNVSRLAQEAIRHELAGRTTTAWLRTVRQIRPSRVTHDEVARATVPLPTRLDAPCGRSHSVSNAARIFPDIASASLSEAVSGGCCAM
jgi:post-segregation antitoxin (ccd killing protein)